MMRWTSPVFRTSAAFSLAAAALVYYEEPRAERIEGNVAASVADKAPATTMSGETPVKRVERPAVVAQEILRQPDDPPEDAVWPEPPADTAAEPRADTRDAAAPTNCLPQELRAVLGEVQQKFAATIVSTTTLHTANHGAGSVRERLHLACQAIDIKTPHAVAEVMAYLRSRPEVGGINTYRNGVIHFDLNSRYAKTGGADTIQPRGGPQKMEGSGR